VRKILFVLLPILVLFFSAHSVFAERLIYPWSETKLTEEERDYFSGLYRESWDYLNAHVAKKTELPFDSTAKQPITSITNAGFYLAAIAITQKTDLISVEDALFRTRTVLSSLEKIEKWRGFPRPWINARSLKPGFGDEFSYGSHLSALLGGLILAKNTFPEFEKKNQCFYFRDEI